MITVTIAVPGQDAPHNVEFDVKVTAGYTPAITQGPADNWMPAEGPEWDALEARVVFKGRSRVLPAKFRDHLEEEHAHLICEALYDELRRS